MVLGVQFVDMAFIPADDLLSLPPLLQPLGPGSALIITFPPQHIAEQVVGDDPAQSFGPLDLLGCRLAGPSRIAVSINQVEFPVISLTVDGILAALQFGAVLPGKPADPAIPGDTAGPTSIEMPWRLAMSVEARSGRGTVTMSHAAEPLELGTGSVGLWRTALRAGDTPAGPLRRDSARARARSMMPPDAGLVLRSIDRMMANLPDPAHFAIPLPQFERNQIVNDARDVPAPAQRLDLSSLGGSLGVRADWPDFQWEHDATLGRDRKVRTAAVGMLYPFGHRATYVEVVERVCVESTPPAMALQTHQTLLITETVRATLARRFPFAEAEIMESVVPVATPHPAEIEWTPHGHGELEFRLQDLDRDLERATLPALVAALGPGTTRHSIGFLTPDEKFEELYGLNPDAAPLEVQTYWQIEDQISLVMRLIHDGTTQNIPLYFWPTAAGPSAPAGSDPLPHRFPVRLAGAMGDVHIEMPLLFVFDNAGSDPLGVLPDFRTLTHPDALKALDKAYADQKAGQAGTGGAAIDLIRSHSPADSDVQEVQRLNVAGIGQGGGFAPVLGKPADDSAAEPWAFEAALPAVRGLLGAAAPDTQMMFSAKYLTEGGAADVVFQTIGAGVPLNFAGRSNLSGGLIAPQLEADAVSRAHGLVQSAGLATLNPAMLLGDASTLLGFKLSDLIDRAALHAPPSITARLDGAIPEVRMEWTGIKLQNASPFVGNGATLTLSVVTGGAGATTSCTVTNFGLALPPDPNTLIEIDFESLVFTQAAGQPPKLGVRTPKVVFKGLLMLVDDLRNHVALGDSAPRIHVDSTGIVAEYLLAIPSAQCAAFVMRNIAFSAVVDVPFTGDPISVTLSFASRANPFNLSVLMFGGGGYLELEVDSRGLQRIEGSLEFGASVAVDFIVASGEVHALGGVQYLLEGGQAQLTGYIRFGGSVEILGLISVSVELRVTLSYDSTANEMYGRATLVIDIDLLLYSDSVHLDTGKWELVGGSGEHPAMRLFAAPQSQPQPEPEPPVDTWRRYRASFARAHA